MWEYVGAIVLIGFVVSMIKVAVTDGWEDRRKLHELLRLRIKVGLQVYTREPLEAGVPYRVIVQGTNSTMYQGSGELRNVTIDAVYFIDDDRRYPRHQGLLFDGAPARVCEEDRSKHRYTFTYVGTGRHLSILLGLPPTHTSNSYNPRPLKVTIRSLTPGETAEIQALEDKRQQEEAEEDRKCLRQQALELAMQAQVESNFLDEEYRQKYAAKHTAAILKTLDHRWRDDYLALKSNERLLALVQTEYPQVLDIYEARIAVVKIAQRLSVEPISPEAKSQLTPEEWAARIDRYRQRTLTRKRVKFEDHKADIMQDLDMLQEFVDELGEYPLDEDERERLITEFKERLLGGEEESQDGYRQL